MKGLDEVDLGACPWWILFISGKAVRDSILAIGDPELCKSGEVHMSTGMHAQICSF